MRQAGRKALYWLPAVLYAALIFYLSSHPAPEAAKAAPIYFDVKIIHVVEYGILSLLINYALCGTTKIPFVWAMIYSVAISYLYGLTDEFHQIFVAARSARLEDTVANFVGAVLFQACAFIYSIRGRRSFKS